MAKKKKSPPKDPLSKSEQRHGKMLERITNLGIPRELIAALAGLTAPPKESFTGAMVQPRIKATTLLGNTLSSMAADQDRFRLWAMEFQLKDASPLDVMNIDALAIKKTKRALKSAKVANAIGIMKLATRPADNDGEAECYRTISVLCYGPENDTQDMFEVERKLQKSFGADGEVAVNRVEPVNFSRAAAKLFDLSDRPVPEAPTKWKKDRSVRDLRRFQALSLVPFKQLCLSIGDGEELLGKILVEGKHWLKIQMKGSVELMHRDQVAQFHAAELVRLGLENWKVPFVRYR